MQFHIRFLIEMMWNRNNIFTIFAISLIALAGAQDEIGCFVPGECDGANALTVLQARSINECLFDCQDFEAADGTECAVITYFLDEETCVLYEDCPSLSTDDCQDCVSSDVGCEDAPCFVEGIGCRGETVDDAFGTGSPQGCLDLCGVTTNCVWATYYEDTDFCLLTSDCGPVESCSDCTTASVRNEECVGEEGPIGDGERNVLVVMGGYNGGGHQSDVEIIDFGGAGSCTGASIADLPETMEYNFGLIETLQSSAGRPMTCAGVTEDPTACYVYNRDADRWDNGPNLNFEREIGAQVCELADGRFYVSGATEAPDRRESEEYRGPEREFEPSPNGPFETKWGCTVEVEGDDRDSTIFIAGGEQEPTTVFFIDPDSGYFERYPEMPSGRKRFACGRASSPEGGWDIVVAGGDQDSFQATASSDIYNTRTGFWRPGPFLPNPLMGPGYIQFEDSFLVIGGYDTDAERYRSEIYEYDPVAEEWITRPEELETERYHFGVAWVGRETLDC